MSTSIPASHFEAMYAAADDPWGFGRRWYEQRKRALTMAVLPRQRFGSAFEPGCSLGHLSRELAGRCDALLVTDVAEAAVAAARGRLAGFPSVQVRRAEIPREWPDGTFDLVVVSELGYYFDDADLGELIERCAGSLAGAGVLLLCHWRHPVAEHYRTGDEVHAAFAAGSGLDRLGGYVDDDLRLDVLVRPPAVSVADREGLVDQADLGVSRAKGASVTRSRR